LVFADYSFLDVFWWMLVLFFWVIAIWILIVVLGDIFRRDDISGWKKAAWIVLIIILPFIGVLSYVIARPKMTAQDVQYMTRAEAAQQAAAGVSTADELAKLDELRSSGAISEAEYQDLKSRTLAT
jgi:type VI protein secretion system component VasK